MKTVNTPITKELVLHHSLSEKDYVTKLLDRLHEVKVDLDIDKMAPWSHSRIKMFSSCPLQFLLKNLMKVVYVPSDEQVKDQDSLLMKYTGLIAHHILEQMVLGQDFVQGYDSARSKYSDNPDINDDIWEACIGLEARLHSFKTRIETFQIRYDSKQLDVEQKLAVDSNGKKVNFNSKNAFYRGILDLSILLHSNHAMIFDHKNGGSSEHGVRNYEQQLKGQALLLTANYPKITHVVPFIHFIQEGTIWGGKVIYQKEVVLDQFLLSIKSRLTGAIDSLIAKGKFSQRSGNQCNYCEFKAHCKVGKRASGGVFKPLIEESKILFRG